MRPISPQIFALAVGLGVIACAAGDEAPPEGGSGGSSDGTGGAAGASGGSVSQGGAAPGGGSGGTVTGGQGTGGSTSGGSATGGQATGGSSTGGSAGTASGGGGTGGKACTNVRPTGTDWDEATCDQWATETEECGNAWMINGNYCNESCGRCSSGGTGGTGTGGTSTGGTSGTGTGGTAPINIPNTCTEPQGTVCNNQSGRHCGYTYEYWKDQGTGCLVNKTNGFSVEWNNVNNLLGRKGLRPGSRNNVVTYQADYQPNGSSYLCVYGWTRNPLVEYYIVDSWGDWRPPGGDPMGTVTADGGIYELYRTQRVNQPSIDGTRTFDQYWSVRTEKRTSGNITVVNHFDAWARVGLNMGSLYEVSMTVEGYQSSGTANVAMIIR